MNHRPRPCYTTKNSTQTLREGLSEYYLINKDLTHPSTQPADFAKILLAHDVSHVIYGCDTHMVDELKLLLLIFWTSDFKFKDWLRERKNPAVEVMYLDLLKRYGIIRLYISIFRALIQLLPESIFLWLKTRDRENFLPFVEFEPLLDRPLGEIRRNFALFSFINH